MELKESTKQNSWKRGHLKFQIFEFDEFIPVKAVDHQNPQNQFTNP